MTALLDVNVLVALFDPEHVHHYVAHDWLTDHGDTNWASCPITELGALRVLADPAFELCMPAAHVAKALRRLFDRDHHQFWSDDLSLLDPAFVDIDRLQGHKQLTDVYLLALAVRNGGQLVTFDGGIPLAAVKGARREHLQILAPAE